MRTFWLFAFVALAAPANDLFGTLTIAGHPHKVTFACAYEEEDPFDKPKIRTAILISTHTETDIRGAACRVAASLLRQQQGPGSAPFLVAYVSPNPVEWNHGLIATQGASYSYSLSGTTPSTKVELGPSAAGGTRLQGSLQTLKEIRIGSGFPATSVDVHFTAMSLDKLEPKTDELTGEPARRHPAVQAAQRMLGVMAKGDAAALRSLMVEAERPMFDKIINSPDKDKFLEIAKLMAADGLKASNSIRVSSRDGVYKVTFSESINLFLIQEQNQWRLTQRR